MTGYEIFQLIGIIFMFSLLLYACYWVGVVHNTGIDETKTP